MSVYRFTSLNCPSCSRPFNRRRDATPVYLTNCGSMGCLSCGRCIGCNCRYNQSCYLDVDEWLDALTKMDKIELSDDKKNYQTTSPYDIILPPKPRSEGDRALLHKAVELELATFQAQHAENEAANLKKKYLEKSMQLDCYESLTISCTGCNSEFPLEELFKCKDCKSTICNTCLTKEHEGHETIATKPKDMSEFIFAKTTKRFDALVAGNERNIRVLNTDIGDKMKEFQAAAQAALDRMKLEPERSVELAHQVNEAADEFERICEKAYPVTRKMNDEFDTLITQFAKICPKPEDVDA